MKVRLLFQDEARFGRISDRRRCWGPLPQRPEVGQQVIREYIYSYAAVSPQDGQLASLILPGVEAEIMSVFLAHTADLFPQDYCLVFLDGAGWHRARDLRIPLNMKLKSLPPYSPELNPVEGLWEYFRGNYFSNRVMTSLDEVEEVLCRAVRHLIQCPDQVRSMTNFDWINTIYLTAN